MSFDQQPKNTAGCLDSLAGSYSQNLQFLPWKIQHLEILVQIQNTLWLGSATVALCDEGVLLWRTTVSQWSPLSCQLIPVSSSTKGVDPQTPLSSAHPTAPQQCKCPPLSTPKEAEYFPMFKRSHWEFNSQIVTSPPSAKTQLKWLSSRLKGLKGSVLFDSEKGHSLPE